MRDILTFKPIPAEFKRIWAKKSRRSAEIMCVSEQGRLGREAWAARPPKDFRKIMEAVRRVQSFAITDGRPMDEILYDHEGMPQCAKD